MSATYSTEYLKAAWRYCTSNEAAVRASTTCGCFYCLETYPAAQVTRFLAVERTALCPECTIDSVLPDASGLPVTDPAFLAAMHETWFGYLEPQKQNDAHA